MNVRPCATALTRALPEPVLDVVDGAHELVGRHDRLGPVRLQQRQTGALRTRDRAHGELGHADQALLEGAVAAEQARQTGQARGQLVVVVHALSPDLPVGTKWRRVAARSLATAAPA